MIMLRMFPLLLIVSLGGGCDLDERPSISHTRSATRRAAAPLEGTVLRVFDGDSLLLRDSAGRSVEVRLATVDAPERNQPFAGVSKRYLTKLTRGERVTVEVRDTDRYGRRVAVVRLDGRDVGLEMIRAGLAWHYRAYAEAQPHVERSSYASAEREAREARRGLWRDARPVPPWAFRRSLRNDATAARP